jgi:MoaA/NifB/PqqE/SkfB family radical SAM enzyme
MAYDPERFHAAYLRGAELPLPIGLPGWQITRVSSDRQRHAIDLLLRGPGGAELLVFVERLVEGASSAARTSLLQLSYYDDNHVPTVEAGHALRALAAVLGAVERRIGEPAARAALHRAVEPVLSELELRINRECNEECVFCNTPADSESILPGRAQILEAIDLEFDKGYRRITFTGREPTLDPSLLDYVRAAKSRGYPTITVASNGTTYAHKPTLAALVEAGMTATKLSLHTFDPQTFRTLIGPPRLLDKTLAGLRNLASYPQVEVQVVVVLTSLNLAQLPGVIERIAREAPSVSHLTISPMAPVGDGRQRADLLPRLTDLAEPLRRGLDAAAAHGIRAEVPPRCGAPLCAMPAGYEHLNREIENRPGDTLEPAKSKLPACRGCRWDDICTGVWSDYLARFDDVRPVPR